jgi:hypothetical protein
VTAATAGRARRPRAAARRATAPCRLDVLCRVASGGSDRRAARGPSPSAARARARTLRLACCATLAGPAAACGDREASADASAPPATAGALPDGTAPGGNTSPAGAPTPRSPPAGAPPPCPPRRPTTRRACSTPSRRSGIPPRSTRVGCRGT